MAISFNKICIIGLGLIGGSIGLAIKRAGISNQVIGHARSRSTLENRLAGLLPIGEEGGQTFVRERVRIERANHIRKLSHAE